MEPKVTFAPGLASDVVKPSRPSRKIPTEKDYGPLAYAIILPRRAMLPQLAETDPDILENVDLAKVWAQSNAIEASLENMCDEARKIWPNTFGCIVDPTFEDGSCYALGFADNTRFENDTLHRHFCFLFILLDYLVALLCCERNTMFFEDHFPLRVPTASFVFDPQVEVTVV
ncbi:hypothetical protein C8R41DRAFT_869568 [Lentinula lateritia]|uniref:Uncharacterized protein n=1 Tax=Lentinula lateritia TaxID=40482 RepID=A0ABQ8V6N1_9AGAR|nr:hypothetical protein C8R41DRAFT_869568 [Lentinula lateritia]